MYNLFGLSLGGFVACEFASRFPNLVDGLILIGIRKRYKAEELQEAKKAVGKNKRAYLYKLYSMNFISSDSMRYFKDNFLKIYIEKFDLGYLLDTLGYLGKSEIKPEMINKIQRIILIHGEKDGIAPIEEAIEIRKNLPQAELITVKGEGHVPLLSKDFKEWIKKL